jgi:tetratricopeptide (TPR) repeat protein
MKFRAILAICLLLLTFGALFADQTVKGDEKAALNSARIFITQGNWDKALAKYEVVLARYSNNIESLNGCADINLEYSRQANKHTPEEITEFQFKALSFYERALTEYNKPENLETNKAKLDEQMAQKDKCIKNRKGCWGQIFNKGIALYNEQKFDEAIALNLRLLEAAPSESRTYEMLALSYQKKGDDAKQIEYLQKAVQVNPKDPALQTQLGNYYYEKKDYAGALRCFQSASEAEPAVAVHFFDIALCYSSLNDSLKAYDIMKRVVQMDPSNIDALIQCSNYAFRAGDQDASLEYNRLAAEVAMATDGFDNVDVYTQLCFKYYKKIAAVKAKSEPLRQKRAALKSKDPAIADLEAQIVQQEKEAVPFFRDLLKYVDPWLKLAPTSEEALTLAVEAAKATANPELEAQYRQRLDALQ